MTSAPQPAERSAAPAPSGQGSRASGRLLGLVRRILDYGRDLVASLQQQNAPTPTAKIAWSFGTIDLARIIARITRGLRIAEALEARLLRCPPTCERPTPPSPRPPAKPRPARPKPTAQPDDDDLILPSAEAIAARIRGRSAGAVIVEICRDLGINTSHPLWREIQAAIRDYNGSMARMMTAWIRVTAFAFEHGPITWPLPTEPGWDQPVAAGTGPP